MANLVRSAKLDLPPVGLRIQSPEIFYNPSHQPKALAGSTPTNFRYPPCAGALRWDAPYPVVLGSGIEGGQESVHDLTREILRVLRYEKHAFLLVSLTLFRLLISCDPHRSCCSILVQSDSDLHFSSLRACLGAVPAMKAEQSFMNAPVWQ